MKGYWNGENATFRGVTYEVTESKDTELHWQNTHVGKREQAIEITYNDHTWLIDNEHGDGFYKVTYGQGSPRCGHKSIDTPINIKTIPDEQIKMVVDTDAIKEEQKKHEEWSSKKNPKIYNQMLELRKSLEKHRKKHNL
ncbi:hypothetical protein PL373_13510 [Tenacibaculum maritimum]|nr:hypothetical protein [Tenacibaculum maritimum]